jgi:hypothetical protein
MNKTQLQTTLAPLVAAIAGFLAGKGYFGWDAQTWIAVLGGIGSLAAVLWGAFATTSSALKNTTANLPATTVVTDKASADKIGNKDVVAATPAIVAAIKKV